MSLLETIERDAIDSAIPVPQLLRSCQVLAARLGHQPFKQWVSWELHGYPDEAELPEYRRAVSAHLVAYMAGMGGSAIKNQPVPVSLLPEPARRSYTEWKFRESVAELQDLVASSRDAGTSSLMRIVPAEVFTQIPEFIQYHSIMEMTSRISVATVVGLLDQVRSRALSFALEIEGENPGAGEAPIGSQPVASDRVSQIFNTTITGGNVVLAAGAEVHQDVNVGEVRAGDAESLVAYLSSQGLADSDVVELHAALEADRKTGETLGARTKAWLGAVTMKIATGAGGIAGQTSAGVIAAAIAKYLGLI
jgi:AbiTii